MRDPGGFGFPALMSHTKTQLLSKNTSRKTYNIEKQREFKMQFKMLITFFQAAYLVYF